MKTKSIFAFDPEQGKVRLFRVIWNRDETASDRAYSAYLSISLLPRLWERTKGACEWRVVILGVSIHYNRSYGGRHC